MRNYYLFLVLVVSFLGNNSYAQNDVYFNQYASIRYLNNPAELTFNRKNGLYYFRRDQWLNSPLKSANNSILTGQLNVSRTVDLGLSISQYNSGNVYSNNAYQMHLAWKGRFYDESNAYFSFGANLKFGSLRTDFSNVLLFDPNDPQIPLTITSQNYWDVGTGFNFKADWLNIGLAFNSLRGYSDVNSNNFLFARTVTYNLGFNLMDADGGDWDTQISRPNIYLRARSINNAVWQGEGFVDFNIHMGKENQRNYTIVGVGVRRDFSTTYYNSILAHINLSFGGRAKLLLGVGPEFSTAPLGNVSSGNIEYIVGIEKGTKTDRFYQSLYEGDALLRQNKYLEAGESYKNAKDIFPNSDLVERREKKTDAISQAWNEFNQFKDFAEQSFRSGNYSLAYDQILIAEKSLNNYKNELKRLTSKTNVPSEESVVRSKKQQYEKAKIANNSYQQGVKLFEEKKYVEALREFERAKTDFQTASVSLSGDLINKMEVCKSIIKRQEEEERIKRIQNLIVTAKEKFKNEEYTGCLYDLNQILNGLDPNNIEAKNLKKDAEQKYQEQELKRRQKECDEHYDLAEKLKGQGKLEEALNEINVAIDVLENCERCDLLKTRIVNEIEEKKKKEFDNLLAEGDKAVKSGNYNLALIYFNKALEIKSDEFLLARIQDCQDRKGSSVSWEKIRESCAKVEVYIDGSMVSSGSCVVIGPRKAITNYHVIDDYFNYPYRTVRFKLVFDQNDEIWVTEISEICESRDLATLIFREEKRFVEIYKPLLKFGEELISITSADGELNSLSKGNLSALPTSSDFYYQVSNPITHGSSGGGIFNNKGQLVALAAAVKEKNVYDYGDLEDNLNAIRAAINYAIPIDNMKYLIRVGKKIK